VAVGFVLDRSPLPLEVVAEMGRTSWLETILDDVVNVRAMGNSYPLHKDRMIGTLERDNMPHLYMYPRAFGEGVE
jgi:hypothetical protein